MLERIPHQIQVDPIPSALEGPGEFILGGLEVEVETLQAESEAEALERAML
jgi:hypothetical protein